MQAFDNMQGYQPQFGANPYPQQSTRLTNAANGDAANDANAAGTARTTRTAGIWIPEYSSRAAVFKFHRTLHRQDRPKAFPACCLLRNLTSRIFCA